MTNLFPALFNPLPLRHKTLRNRIVFGAHTANMSDLGLPGERHRGYYEERARGGAGMIVVEPVPVHRTAVLTRGNFRHSTDEIIPHFRKVTDAVHAHGAVICHQLYHVGQHGDLDNSYEASWSPSGLPSFHDSDGSHAMNEAEIEEIIEGFVEAARRAKESGFDGIELFAAYNAIIDQFWLPWSNRRTDQWGGSLENRLRFGAEIMRRIRAAVGDRPDGTPVVLRIRGDRDDVFSHGYLCPKGSTLRQLHEDPDRLRRPMVKRDGVHVEVEWDEAWHVIAERLPQIIRDHGRESVAVYMGNPSAHSLSASRSPSGMR